MTEKYHSINAVRKRFFPIAYKKEMEEKAIERIGIGKYLAQQFLRTVRETLNE